jgi:8-oxo-dGTP diphosphatase
MRLKTIVKAIVIDKKGDLLLLRREPNDPNRPGEWDFPGGGIESDEDIANGLEREIFEETGLRIDVSSDKLFYAATEFYQAVNATRLMFIVGYSDGEIKLSHEHDCYKWVDYKTALELFPHRVYSVGLKYAMEHDLLPKNDINAS